MRHLRIHTNEKTFECDVYQESFARKQNLLDYFHTQLNVVMSKNHLVLKET